MSSSKSWMNHRISTAVDRKDIESPNCSAKADDLNWRHNCILVRGWLPLCHNLQCQSGVWSRKYFGYKKNILVPKNIFVIICNVNQVWSKWKYFSHKKNYFDLQYLGHNLQCQSGLIPKLFWLEKKIFWSKSAMSIRLDPRSILGTKYFGHSLKCQPGLIPQIFWSQKLFWSRKYFLR